MGQENKPPSYIPRNTIVINAGHRSNLLTLVALPLQSVHQRHIDKVAR
jgi:hypothetical protein